MRHLSKKKSVTAIIVLSLAVISAVIIFHRKNRDTVNIGISGSPLLSPLYYANTLPGWDKKFRLVNFDTSADIGYALISGELKIAFMEPSKALIVKKFPEFGNIDVIGKITYPYGAALVVRRGLDLKVQDLPGHTVAASEDTCKLYHALKKDLAWLHVDASKIKFEFMPFDAMIPAIEAGKIDAAITKGSYALIAQKLGHTIPYLQWDIAAGDECCPAVVAQTEYLLLARKDAKDASDKLVKLLAASQSAQSGELIAVASKATGIPEKTLESLPSPSFSLADAPLLQLFEDAAEDEAKDRAAQAKK
jgi:ABC-type nitrate/sulfonate/bicarbonate transport system substrate-binding protein